MRIAAAVCGPLCSGKTTLMKEVGERRGWQYYSTSSLATHAFGPSAKAIMEAGQLLPDPMVFEPLGQALAKSKADVSIVDSVPRTETQIDLFERMCRDTGHMPVYVIITLPCYQALEWARDRYVCSECRSPYSVSQHRAHDNAPCRTLTCSGRMVRRLDDDKFQERWWDYLLKTEPALDTLVRRRSRVFRLPVQEPNAACTIAASIASCLPQADRESSLELIGLKSRQFA